MPAIEAVLGATSWCISLKIEALPGRSWIIWPWLPQIKPRSLYYFYQLAALLKDKTGNRITLRWVDRIRTIEFWKRAFHPWNPMGGFLVLPLSDQKEIGQFMIDFKREHSSVESERWYTNLMDADDPLHVFLGSLGKGSSDPNKTLDRSRSLLTTK